jgi:branched-chain amino acid transport system ATP-binding protein
MSEEAILQVFNVSKAFGGVQALLNVSFSVQKGEVFGIIGPNGSGKTTLINCITGFIKMNSVRFSIKAKRLVTGRPIRLPILASQELSRS